MNSPSICRWAVGALRQSMTAQIVVAITLVSALLVAGSSYVIVRISRDALRESGDMVMLASLAVLHEELKEASYEVPRVSHELVTRVESQLGNLHVALLDEQRRVIAASDWFDVPVASLPRATLAADELPSHITHQKVRGLAKRYGAIAENWTAPDGRTFRVLLARIDVPPQYAAAGHSSLLVAMALEAAQARELVMRGWEIIGSALLLSAVCAGLLGVFIARHIVVVARKFGTAASRISAQALHERLPLGRAPRELLDSGIAFNRMLDRLESAFKRLSEFSSDLAHELRTPINNLLGEAQVTLARPRNATEYRAVIESAVEDYERMSRLIENMLFLARAEDAQGSLKCEWIDMDSTSACVHDYFEPLGDEHGVRIDCRPRGPATVGGRRVWADKTMMRRAVANLVSNALRYAPPHTTIELHCTMHDDGSCSLEVSNEGPPIAPEHQARIFDRLYRVDPSREGSATGSGLGLAIVKSIMELHGGRVAVRSAPAQPTVFCLWFPAPPIGVQAPARAEAVEVVA